MSVPVFITGTGLVSAQGVGVEQNWQNLLAGRVLHETGIVPLERDNALPRVSQLAIRAAGEALAAAGGPSLNDPRTALIVGTSKGPIEDWIDQLNGHRPPDITLGASRVAVDVATNLGHACGPRLTFAGACASGLHALIRAADLIRQGTCDQALVVAAEASTHALFQANFARLGVLADPVEGCRPFDVGRKGFLLAEAAAAVWLTSRPTANSVCVEGGLFLADAVHLTGPDRDSRTLRYVLGELRTPGINLVHAHGTGTVLNDAAEWSAINAVLTPDRPAVYSHKHAIGHTQGAAGLIGVVLNTEMHRRQCVLGNTNSPRPITTATPTAARTRLSTEAVLMPINNSVVIAAGFGGTIAAVRLRSQRPTTDVAKLAS